MRADLRKIVEDALTVSRSQWRYVARVDLALEPDLPHVACRPGEIGQVVLNLIVNAAQEIASSLNEGGGAGSEVRLDAEPQGRIGIEVRSHDGGVEVRIQDSGRGVPPDLRDRIFEPFFTTKEVGSGTGQGLAIAHAVVKRHGGRIGCDDVAGGGSCFWLWLPLDPDPSSRAAAGGV